jgi:hypothetical protein
MGDDLEKRLERLQKILREQYGSRPGGGGLMSIAVYGGLMPDPIIGMTENGGEWFRDYPTEEVEVFGARCLQAAAEMGAKHLLITSIPRDGDAKQYEVARAAHAIYMDRFYPEVPPEEPRGYIRPNRGLLA